MKALLEYIDTKTRAYEQLPLFTFMRDDRLDARERLGFVPALAHFVMSFSDMYVHVLRDEPTTDQFQALVNAHTHEDAGHWKWFLADLAILGEDPTQRFSDSLRVLWSEKTVKLRLLAYEMAKLGLRASPLERLVLVHCIEAVGAVSLAAAAPLGRELGERAGKPLVYFGPHHVDTESNHTLEDEGVHSRLEAVTIEPAQRPGLHEIIDRSFAAFGDFSDDLLRFAEARRH
jgi:hypothetical protein